mgnify:CR=1 FL=1
MYKRQGDIKEKEMMSKHTYYGIGGPADAYITPKDKEDLSMILRFAYSNSIPAYFIGSGSNLLISDDGINGLVLNPGKAFRHLKFNDSNLYAESGAMLGRIVRESIKRNLSGLESLIGVPGTLGGALVMNAGAFGGEISNYLKVPLLKATIKKFPDKEIFVEIQENVRGEDVFVIQSTSFPANDHLMELLVTIDALKRGSAKRIAAIMPYYGYARQDRKSGPRTPISAKLIANLISTAGADRALTVSYTHLTLPTKA